MHHHEAKFGKSRVQLTSPLCGKLWNFCYWGKRNSRLLSILNQNIGRQSRRRQLEITILYLWSFATYNVSVFSNKLLIGKLAASDPSNCAISPSFSHCSSTGLVSLLFSSTLINFSLSTFFGACLALLPFSSVFSNKLSNSLSVSLSLLISLSLSLCLSISLSLYLSIFLSFCFSVSLSLRLSISQ